MSKFITSDHITPPELRCASLRLLCEKNPTRKSTGVSKLAEDWKARLLSLDPSARIKSPDQIPGYPDKPALVPPQDVVRRPMNTQEGRAAMIHALAHIEFNAINLALDVIWRFPDMPETYYSDWLKVAAEEAFHFTLLSNHLVTLGYSYGDFPAHNGLWDMAEKTQDDILARIAAVPRTMEARGLDVSPRLRNKLVQAGDTEAGNILDIILHDEIGHVSIGNYWYHWLCERRALDPGITYTDLVKKYGIPVLRTPLNIEARKAAGFTEAELATLADL
jgi:uncharacterized ferritin-like protein (DUF455 family)